MLGLVLVFVAVRLALLQSRSFCYNVAKFVCFFLEESWRCILTKGTNSNGGSGPAGNRENGAESVTPIVRAETVPDPIVVEDVIV